MLGAENPKLKRIELNLIFIGSPETVDRVKEEVLLRLKNTNEHHIDFLAESTVSESTEKILEPIK